MTRLSKEAWITILSLVCISTALVLHFGFDADPNIYHIPLYVCLVGGGLPLIWDILVKLFRGSFGADFLAGISIATSMVLDEHLAGCLVVLMLSGGEALERYAVGRASATLKALANRMPTIAHRRRGTKLEEVSLDKIQSGDEIVVLPHEACPVDGVVIEGHGSMDEAYLTGEPYQISKTIGSEVLSGAINSESALVVQTSRVPSDSRYAKLVKTIGHAEEGRTPSRRLGDALGGLYTPIALIVAFLAWYLSGDARRFLGVLVVATPCPLLIAIPVGILGAISLAARRSIVIRDPAILELISTCRTMIFDKTGTLTYGRPELTAVIAGPGFDENQALQLAASLERFSKHPLAVAIRDGAAARGLTDLEVSELSERPGQGLVGKVAGKNIKMTNRVQAKSLGNSGLDNIPVTAGLECVVLVDDKFAALLQFRDAPRAESKHFVDHLSPRHDFDRVVIISGDRESEVRYLADQVGISEIYAGQNPEQKLELVKKETSKAKTLYLGDGINDAPAMLASTVGVALGTKSDVTAEAAGATVLDSSLSKVDELLHIGQHMRQVILQSALGGMGLSIIGMLLAAAGHLTPVFGALTQEAIDLFAVVNALRAAYPPKRLTDFGVR